MPHCDTPHPQKLEKRDRQLATSVRELRYFKQLIVTLLSEEPQLIDNAHIPQDLAAIRDQPRPLSADQVTAVHQHLQSSSALLVQQIAEFQRTLQSKPKPFTAPEMADKTVDTNDATFRDMLQPEHFSPRRVPVMPHVIMPHSPRTPHSLMQPQQQHLQHLQQQQQLLQTRLGVSAAVRQAPGQLGPTPQGTRNPRIYA